MDKKPPVLSRWPRTKADWRKWTEHNLEFAAEHLIQFGQLAPMIVIHGRDGSYRAMESVEGNRDKSLVVWRVACIAHDATGFCFLSEGWLRTVQKRIGESEAELYERGKAFPPSEAHDRIEVVNICTVWRSVDNQLQSMARTRRIARDEDGKITGLEKDSKLPGDNMKQDGQIAKLILLADPPTPYEVGRAKEALGQLITV